MNWFARARDEKAIQASHWEVKTNLTFRQNRKGLLHRKLNRRAQGPNALSLFLLHPSMRPSTFLVTSHSSSLLETRNSARNFLNQVSKPKHMARFTLLFFLIFTLLGNDSTLQPRCLWKNGMRNNEFPFEFTTFLRKSPREKRAYFMIYCRFLDSRCVPTENNNFL